MKCVLSFIVAVMFATQAWAQTTFIVDGLKYTLTGNNIVSVGKGSKELSGAIEIPSKVTYPQNFGKTYTVTSIGEGAFLGCYSLTSIAIPNTVTSIGNSAFAFCIGLTSIEIPNSVTSIGYLVFQNCSGLTSITIPESVTSIGDGAFSGCSSLQSITLPFVGDKAHITTGNYLYSFGHIFGGISYEGGTATSQYDPDISSTAITTYYIPTSLKEVIITGSEHITKGAFVNCTNLTSVTIPNTVTSIDQQAFAGCSGLTSITIPNSVISIGQEAFTACSGMKSVTIGNSVTSIGQSAFIGCSSLESVTIGNSVTSIGDYAFDGCSGLTSVTIPESVTSIGDRAFFLCDGLTSVTIGNSVTSIGNQTFGHCSNLVSVTIGNSVTTIGHRAFECCSNLTTITMGISVTSISDEAFVGCSGLKEINVESDNTKYSSQDGVLFNKDKTTIILYPAGRTGTYTIPNSVTSIGREAFYTCSGLASVTIPNSVTSIGVSAFAYCSGLGAVTIGNSVTTIGGEAFYECRNLKYITIGNSVTSIGARAFYNCRGLTWIVYDGTHQPTCGTDAFDRVNPSVPVCVPEEYEGDSWCGLRLHDIVSLFPTVTCTEAGFIGGSCCLKCERILVAPQEVDALGHDWSTPTYKWAEDGHACSATAVCKRNEDHIATEEVTATSEETVAATCEEMGTTTYTATFENEPFTTQTKTVVDIPATGHTADSVEFENIVPATCTAAGSKDSVVFCSVCQAELSREEKEIAPLGHTPNSVEFENIVPTTCTTVGTYDSVVYCSVCQVELFREEKEVAALGHTYNSAITAPTCTAVGYTTHTCSVCEHTYYSDTIDAKGHTEVVNEAVAPTCTATGKTEGKHCSVCNAVLVAQEEVAALGHEFKDYVYNNDATTAADGTETATCERGCGATDTRIAEGTKLPETEKGTAVSEVASTLNIYAHGNTIVVENATDEISIYNAMGTLVCRNATPCVRTEILITAPGIYIVKVGGTAKRVMVE